MNMRMAAYLLRIAQGAFWAFTCWRSEVQSVFEAFLLSL